MSEETTKPARPAFIAFGLIGIVAIFVGAWFFWPGAETARQDTAAKSAVTANPPGLAPLPKQTKTAISDYLDADALFELPADGVEKTVTIKRGQTLMVVLRSAGVPGNKAHEAITAMRSVFRPRDLRPGHVLHIYFGPPTDSKSEGDFEGYEFAATPVRSILVRRDDKGGFAATKIDRVLEQKDVRIAGTIKSSLYVDATRAGLSPQTMIEVIRLFSWDVDFQRDIHPGDRFDVLVTRSHLPNGDVAGWGTVDFTSLTLRGKAHRLYRFTSKKNGVEYFDENGRSAQKALMKTPINGARLSSRFGLRRHPILKYTKLHRGIDFAAPSGTPIFAAGNGTVVYAGRKGGYGNYIRIRHNDRYSTAYAHLKGFRRGVRKGRRVRQGQVIGYVGTTGRSTGPHLHYEVLVRGKQINPLRLKLPSGRKLKGTELDRFRKIRDAIKERLAALPVSEDKAASQ